MTPVTTLVDRNIPVLTTQDILQYITSTLNTNPLGLEFLLDKEKAKKQLARDFAQHKKPKILEDSQLQTYIAPASISRYLISSFETLLVTQPLTYVFPEDIIARMRGPKDNPRPEHLIPTLCRIEPGSEINLTDTTNGIYKKCKAEGKLHILTHAIFTRSIPTHYRVTPEKTLQEIPTKTKRDPYYFFLDHLFPGNPQEYFGQ